MNKRSSKPSAVFACMLKPLGWFPIVIINAIALWSYFAYVVILCFDNIDDPVTRALYLVFYHPFFLMFMISYWQAIMSSPGYLPRQFFLSQEDSERYENAENPQQVIDEFAKTLPVITLSVTKSARFCEPCHAVKADRCHHCSMCQKCILKMDHHCPWINNCVGWGNYKYFILFLSYSVLYTMYVAFTSLKYFIKFWSGPNMKANSNLHILFLFFVSAMFSISLWSLLGFHIYLTLTNRTTLESFRPAVFHHGPDKNGFNLGKANNYKQIFGNKKWKWFLPIFSTSGNGYVFRTSRSNGSSEPESVDYFHRDEEDDTSTNERAGLLNSEETATICTGAHFVNSSDIKLDSYLGKTVSVSDGEDDGDEVYNMSQVRNNSDIKLDLSAADG